MAISLSYTTPRATRILKWTCTLYLPSGQRCVRGRAHSNGIPGAGKRTRAATRCSRAASSTCTRQYKFIRLALRKSQKHKAEVVQAGPLLPAPAHPRLMGEGSPLCWTAPPARGGVALQTAPAPRARSLHIAPPPAAALIPVASASALVSLS